MVSTVESAFLRGLLSQEGPGKGVAVGQNTALLLENLRGKNVLQGKDIESFEDREALKVRTVEEGIRQRQEGLDIQRQGQINQAAKTTATNLAKLKKEEREELVRTSRIIAGSTEGQDLSSVLDADDLAAFTADPNSARQQAQLILEGAGEGVKPETFGQAKTVIGDDGKPILAQIGNRGTVRPIEGASPLPSKGERISIDPNTGEVVIERGVTVGGEASALTRGTQTTLQKDLIALEDTAARVDGIAIDFDPSFLTFQGKISGFIDAIKSKANIDLTEDERDFLQRKTRFDNRVNQFFNLYRKMITGAAASVQELEGLKKSVLNEDQSPAEFEASLGLFQEELKRGVRLRRKFLREGISTSNEEGGDAFDRAFLGQDDDDARVRFNEIKAENPEMADQDIINQLAKEGYTSGR